MRVDMVPGGTYDLVSNQEMDAHIKSIHSKMSEFVRQEVQGIKPIRFLAHANVAANTGLVLPAQVAPRSGYVWSIAIATVQTTGNSGLANMYFGRATNPTDITVPTAAVPDAPENHQFVVAAFNGQTIQFAKTQCLINAGEYPLFFGLNAGGTVATVTLTGTAIEIPAEMVGKLLL